MCYQPWVMWLLDMPGHAADGLAYARRCDHAHTLAYALFVSGILLELLKGNAAVVRQNTREMAEISRQHGLGLWSIGAQIVDAWLDGRSGKSPEAIDRLRTGLVALRMTGTGVFRPFFLSLYAETLAAAGRMGEALQALDEGLAHVEATAERWFEPELHRLRGETLLKMNNANSEGAERWLRTALLTAREQKARRWEIRAELSLARIGASIDRVVGIDTLLAGA